MPRAPIAEKSRQAVLELHRQGRTTRQIAVLTGIGHTSVSLILSKQYGARNSRGVLQSSGLPDLSGNSS